MIVALSVHRLYCFSSRSKLLSLVASAGRPGGLYLSHANHRLNTGIIPNLASGDVTTKTQTVI